MRSIEKVSLQDYIAQVSDFCTPYTTARRFYSYIDRLGQESLQKVSFENDYEFLKKASTVLNIILSIITHPHIANRREEIVARIEQGKPGAICFFANPKYEHYVYECKADIIIVKAVCGG